MSDSPRRRIPEASISAALEALPMKAQKVLAPIDIERALLAALEHIEPSKTELTGDSDRHAVAGRTLFRPYKSQKR